MPEETILTASGVTKRYGPLTVLDAVDLTIERGQILSLLGPNGAGKTTFVSIVAGLRRADAGTVKVCGIDVSIDPDAVRQRIGYAPQDLGIYPTLTARENLTVLGQIAGLRGRQLRTRIDELGDALALSDLLGRPAGVLSGGQKRRLHTAMALVASPPLLLLDEPTVGADVESRFALLALVRTLAQEGAAVCYTTHYLTEVEELGAQVAMLRAGRIVARGSISELVAAHASAFVALAFEGPIPRIDGAIPDPTDRSRVRVTGPDPAATAASVIASLGVDSARLRSVELIRPGLESAYRAVMGSAPVTEHDEETVGVAAS